MIGCALDLHIDSDGPLAGRQVGQIDQWQGEQNAPGIAGGNSAGDGRAAAGILQGNGKRSGSRGSLQSELEGFVSVVAHGIVVDEGKGLGGGAGTENQKDKEDEFEEPSYGWTHIGTGAMYVKSCYFDKHILAAKKQGSKIKMKIMIRKRIKSKITRLA